MFEIIEAVKAKFDATPALVGALKKLYFLHAPQRAAVPYVVFNVEADEPEENTGKRYVQQVRVTFEIYARRAGDFEASAELIRDAYFRKPLTLGAGGIIGAKLTDEGIEDMESDDDARPEAFYRMVIEYTQVQTRP